jgi:hypothetical protein
MTSKSHKKHAPAAGDGELREMVREYKDIAKDYTFDPDIFNAEPDRLADVKYIINERLNQVDRTIIILYVDCQSLRKLGERLGCSHTLIAKEVRRIKARILAEYEQMQKTKK